LAPSLALLWGRSAVAPVRRRWSVAVKAIALSLIFFLPNVANAAEFTLADVCNREFSLKDHSMSYLRWLQELDTCLKDAENLQPQINKLPKAERAKAQKVLNCVVHAESLEEQKACRPEKVREEAKAEKKKGDLTSAVTRAEDPPTPHDVCIQRAEVAKRAGVDAGSLESCIALYSQSDPKWFAEYAPCVLAAQSLSAIDKCQDTPSQVKERELVAKQVLEFADNPKIQQIVASVSFCLRALDEKEAREAIKAEHKASRLGGIINMTNLRAFQDYAVAAQAAQKRLRAALREIKKQPMSCKQPVVRALASCIDERSSECEADETMFTDVELKAVHHLAARESGVTNVDQYYGLQQFTRDALADHGPRQ